MAHKAWLAAAIASPIRPLLLFLGRTACPDGKGEGADGGGGGGAVEEHPEEEPPEDDPEVDPDDP